MTRNRHDAEEVVQEAFLRGYQKLGQFAARSNFGTWVYRIAANYAIDRMRQRQKEEARREAPRAEDRDRSEEHTSELQSHHDLVCRLLLEKKKKKTQEV